MADPSQRPVMAAYRNGRCVASMDLPPLMAAGDFAAEIQRWSDCGYEIRKTTAGGATASMLAALEKVRG